MSDRFHPGRQLCYSVGAASYYIILVSANAKKQSFIYEPLKKLVDYLRLNFYTIA